MRTPTIAAATGSGNIPSSITLDYLLQSRNEPANAAIYVAGGFTTITVMLRCVTRLWVKRFWVDDALAITSLILQIGFLVLSIILIDIGAGRHIEYIKYVLTQSQTDETERLDFAAHLIYTTALFVCRLSGLAFYHRLCELHDKLSISIKCAVILLIAAYLPQMLLIILHCRPVTALWPYSWQPGFEHFVCIPWGAVYVTNSTLSLVCDLFMFAIPMALIHTLGLSTKSKTRLYFVLLPGILVIIISSIRLYLVVKGQWLADGSWYYCPMLAIENAEIGGTLIALSIPGLKPLFTQWFSTPQTQHCRNPRSGLSLPPLGSLEVSSGFSEEIVRPETTVAAAAGSRWEQAIDWREIHFVNYEVGGESRSGPTVERVSSWGDWSYHSQKAP